MRGSLAHPTRAAGSRRSHATEPLGSGHRCDGYSGVAVAWTVRGDPDRDWRARVRRGRAGAAGLPARGLGAGDAHSGEDHPARPFSGRPTVDTEPPASAETTA